MANNGCGLHAPPDLGDLRGRRVLLVGPGRTGPVATRFIYALTMNLLKGRPAQLLLLARGGANTAALLAASKLKQVDDALSDFELIVIAPGHLADASDEFQRALRASHLKVNQADADDPSRLFRYRVRVQELRMDAGHPSSLATAIDLALGRAGWSATCALLVALADGVDSVVIRAVQRARAERMSVIEVLLPIDLEASS